MCAPVARWSGWTDGQRHTTAYTYTYPSASRSLAAYMYSQSRLTSHLRLTMAQTCRLLFCHIQSYSASRTLVCCLEVGPRPRYLVRIQGKSSQCCEGLDVAAVRERGKAKSDMAVRCSERMGMVTQLPARSRGGFSSHSAYVCVSSRLSSSSERILALK